MADLYTDGFWVYEHELRPHRILLGAPAVRNGWISYDDGQSLHIPAFRLGEPDAVLTDDTLREIIADRLTGERRRFVSIWGRIGFSENLDIKHYRVAHDAQPTASADVADLAATSELSSAASRALRRARNLGYACQSSTAELTPRHLAIMDIWLDRHDVSISHRAFALACVESYERGECIRLDITCESELVGFGLLSFPTSRDAVYLQGFLVNSPGSRTGDSLLGEMVSLCRASDVQRLHLGYTSTAGLRRFKAKWGGREDERTRYRELVLLHDDESPPKHLSAKDAAIRTIRWLAGD